MFLQCDFIENLIEICSLHLAPMTLTQLLIIAPKSLATSVHADKVVNREKKPRESGHSRLSAVGPHAQEREALWGITL